MPRTYFQFPDADCPPEGPLMLGHILDDPWKPYESLNADDRIEVPEGICYTSTKTGLTTSTKWDKEFKAGLWAQVLEGAYGGGIGVKRSKGANQALAINALETTFIWPAKGDTKTYIRDSVLLPGVQSFLSGCRYKQPVYLVVGLKIVRKGASMDTRMTRGNEATAAFMVDGALAGGPPVELGPQATRSSAHEDALGFEDSDEFVLAYRLRKITCTKGLVLTDDAYDQGNLFDLKSGDKSSSTAAEVTGKVDEDDFALDNFTGYGVIGIQDEEDVEDCICIIPPST